MRGTVTMLSARSGIFIPLYWILMMLIMLVDGLETHISTHKYSNLFSASSVSGSVMMQQSPEQSTIIQDEENLHKAGKSANNNFKRDFLKPGELESAINATNLPRTHIESRLSRIKHLTSVSHKDKIFKSLVLDQILLNVSMKELKELKISLHALEEICETAEYANNVYKTYFCRNISESHFDTKDSDAISVLINSSLTLGRIKLILKFFKVNWTRYNESNYIAFPKINFDHLVCEKLWPNETMETLKNDSLDQSKITALFQYYIYPGMYLLILVIGLAGNATLLLIFSRHKEVRTAANIMLFNLAIADVTNLLINTPLYYMFKYHNDVIYAYLGEYGCRSFVVFRFLNVVVIEVSILSLSAQRYFATVSSLKITKRRCRPSRRTTAAIYILSVWVVGLIISLPPNIIFEFPQGECFPVVKESDLTKVLDVLYCLFDSVFLPVVIATFSLLTARLLRRSVHNISGIVTNSEQIMARYRSAKVVTALAFAFFICFIPRSVWFFVASYTKINRQEVVFVCVDEVTNYLSFANSCVNPIAMYKASSLLRKLFNKYLFKCSYTQKDEMNDAEKSLDSRNISPHSV